MRLSVKTSGALPSSVQRPAYDRSRQARGIVHFGLGAFTRAHQIAYTDDAMNAGDEGWMVTGVSMRSSSVKNNLAPQAGLYLLAEQSETGARYRLVGALRDVLVAPDQPEQVIAALADPQTHVVTFTITEKGYLRSAAGGLDPDNADIESDLAGIGDPRTIYGFLYEAMARRMRGGLGGVTLVCCDNLASNGTLLRALVEAFLDRRDPTVADWFRENCTCPSTMVDRIVPATTKADIDAAEAACGLRDEGLVVTEPFGQWAIEDRFAGPRPNWEVGGAQIVGDVAPYEAAKLRMLNGAHSALAYIGLDRGHEYVHQAIGDPYLRDLVVRLMKDEAAPSIAAAPGQDLDGYADALVARFENPALNHRLSQIAMDGSQKIPQRWLETLMVARRDNRDCPNILTALAHWLGHVSGDRRAVVDPLAEAFVQAWHSGGAEGLLAACFAQDGLIETQWRPDPSEQAFLVNCLTKM